MPGIAAGRLRQLVELRRKSEAPDGSGGRTTSWSTVATIPAEAISQNGREAVLAGTLAGVSSWKVTMRWREDISTVDQLRLDGRDLNIRSVEDPDGRRAQLVIFADTGSAQ